MEEKWSCSRVTSVFDSIYLNEILVDVRLNKLLTIESEFLLHEDNVIISREKN